MSSIVSSNLAQWQWHALGNQRFAVRALSLAVCRGELSALITRFSLNVCEMGGKGSEKLKRYPPPSPTACDSWMVVRKKTSVKDIGLKGLRSYSS